MGKPKHDPDAPAPSSEAANNRSEPTAVGAAAITFLSLIAIAAGLRFVAAVYTKKKVGTAVG